MRTWGKPCVVGWGGDGSRGGGLLGWVQGCVQGCVQVVKTMDTLHGALFMCVKFPGW